MAWFWQGTREPGARPGRTDVHPGGDVLSRLRALLGDGLCRHDGAEQDHVAGIVGADGTVELHRLQGLHLVLAYLLRITGHRRTATVGRLLGKTRGDVTRQ